MMTGEKNGRIGEEVGRSRIEAGGGEREEEKREISLRVCTTPGLCSIKENAYCIILPL